MSKNIDWSQFEPVNNVESGNSQSIDWSKFEPVQREKSKEKTIPEKAGRVASQAALGLAENVLLPYELSVAPLASKEAQQVPFRENIGEDIENLLLQKSTGVWSPQDENLLKSLQEQIQNPRKSEPFLKTADIGLRGVAEKVTGKNLRPEGFLEKAANWAGFIKNPKIITDLGKQGFKLPQLVKAIVPGMTDILRGAGAGIALEMAEEGEFGPIGTMGAAVLGDILGSGASKGLKTTAKLLTSPQKTLAEAAIKFTPADKIKMQKNLVKDFQEAGLQADLGTLTDSNLIKSTQARLAQSGLTGKALDNFKEQLTNQIKDQYHDLANVLGEVKVASQHEAGEILKEGVRKIRDSDLSTIRNLYQSAEKSLKGKAFVNSGKLAESIKKLEDQLSPGQLKSGEQKVVLETLDKLKRDIFDSSGRPIYANVKELMNNKIALNDIINYEVQGGSKQLLKNIVSEIDRAIISHGKENPTFAKNYINANKRFAEHAKTFRNKNIDQLLRSHDPAQLMNKMNSVQGIRDINNVLSKSPEGKEIFNSLKRNKLDRIIGDNLVDSTTQQAKFGTFSKILEKGKNREIVKEILGKEGFKRLERLQKNAGRLAESIQKFYNASKSGVAAVDAAVLAKGLNDIASVLFSGNPWPLMRTLGGVLGARKLSNLITDPNFLKLVENAILVSEKGTTKEMLNAFEKLKPFVIPFVQNQQD